MAASFFSQVKRIPAGFKKLYAETKAVMLLKEKKKGLSVGSLSRREEELIRTNSNDLVKMGGFFLVQLPPIIGYLPVFVYLNFPRQLLTRHFWDEAHFHKYMHEIHLETRSYSKQFDNAYIGGGSERAMPLQTPPLGSMPRPQLTMLAAATGVCSASVLLRLLPKCILLLWLRQYASDIMHDDHLLTHEKLAHPEQPPTPSNTTTVEYQENRLKLHELQLACVRRGISPDHSLQNGDNNINADAATATTTTTTTAATTLREEQWTTELRGRLHEWLELQELLKQANPQQQHSRSLVLHMIASPKLFAEIKKSLKSIPSTSIVK